MIWDVRFLPNPFYIPEYRHKTGRVQVVNDYIHSFDVTDEFKTHYFNTMDFLVPNYEKEGKAQFIVAVGCTGGIAPLCCHGRGFVCSFIRKRLSCHGGTSGYDEE